MADRFGRLPEAAENLFDMVRVRILGEALGAEKISIERAEVVLEFPAGTPRERVLEVARRSQSFPGGIRRHRPGHAQAAAGDDEGLAREAGYVIRFLQTLVDEPRPVPVKP